VGLRRLLVNPRKPALPNTFVSFSAIALSLLPVASLAAPPLSSAPPRLGTPVLDIEKRRVAESRFFPSDAGPTCDVLVIGGGVGGVGAAIGAARHGLSVIIVEPTQTLGGQFTSQMVPVPDENRFIEQKNGPSTQAYRALRERVRADVAKLPNIKPGQEKNVGQCWVSRVSGTPEMWAQAINDQIKAVPTVMGVKRILLRHQVRSITRLANGRVNYADLVDLDTGKVTRIGTRYLLDATEDGSALTLADLPTTIGQEAKSEYAEPHAPDTPHPEWVQSFSYCFPVRWQEEAGAVRQIVEKPAEYDYFKSLGEYTLDYVYSERGTVTYKMLTKAEGAGGPFWTYRRLLASNAFTGGKSPQGDIALMNWRGNDFHEESLLGKSIEEQARILQRGKAFAQGFLYWLQTECPRDDGSGFGYPEIQLVTPGTAEAGAQSASLSEDGFAMVPYVRESRRLQAKYMLQEKDLIAPPNDPNAKWATAFPDSVGCALYAIDIHPTKGEPPLLVPALPYHIPLGAFLTKSGATNVLPAAKNFGATRLALASARMHPTEWLVGEVAGDLAAFCIRRGIDDPSVVRDTPALLAAFQQQLRKDGVTLYWSEIIDPNAK
jgi:hypothetical protein